MISFFITAREYWHRKVRHTIEYLFYRFLIGHWKNKKQYFVLIKTTYSSRYAFVACNSWYAKYSLSQHCFFQNGKEGSAARKKSETEVEIFLFLSLEAFLLWDEEILRLVKTDGRISRGSVILRWTWKFSFAIFSLCLKNQHNLSRCNYLLWSTYHNRKTNNCSRT